MADEPTAKPPTVAFLGPPGSFTHQAALNYFANPSAHELVAETTIEAVVTAVEQGTTTFGVVPFENSSAGSVQPTLDRLLLSARTFPGRIHIIDQYYLPIHQCLLARDDLLTLADVTQVYSHPMGFSQCSQWLLQHLPHAERVEVTSTSKAAELAALNPGTVAIGSQATTQLYKVRVWLPNIEDQSDNVTRFFVLHQSPGRPTAEDRTYLYFTLDHSKPGSLCQALDAFRVGHLNLSKIDTRPSHLQPWHFYFMVECDGHYSQARVKAVVAALQSVCEKVGVLGSYSSLWRLT
ncbi:prephenate dehydratase [Dimargaris cristalligena]|nr:prephenate dehydratase [Dimargaris cristalligena]